MHEHSFVHYLRPLVLRSLQALISSADLLSVVRCWLYGCVRRPISLGVPLLQKVLDQRTEFLVLALDDFDLCTVAPYELLVRQNHYLVLRYVYRLPLASFCHHDALSRFPTACSHHTFASMAFLRLAVSVLGPRRVCEGLKSKPTLRSR